jgi:acyl transferase domain-containing protein
MTTLHQKPRVAFLFTGQGSQYPGMARTLYATEAAARHTLDECEDAFRALRGESLLDVLLRDDATKIHDTAWAQPALYALEVALGTVWMQAGVEPAFVLGHSIGELGAACIAGACSVRDGLALAAERGRLMQELPRTGSMLAVRAEVAAVEGWISRFTRLDIAAVNGPNAVVISGDTSEIDALETELGELGVAAQRLTVSHAFHSHLMTPMMEPFRACASHLTFARPRVPFLSTLFARVLGEGDELDAEYWVEHIRKPVRFMDGAKALAASGADVWLEVGPDATLIKLAKKIVRGGYVGIGSLENGADAGETLARAAETLRGAGVPVVFEHEAASTLRAIPISVRPALEQREERP